jgi:hypothetical protein
MDARGRRDHSGSYINLGYLVPQQCTTGPARPVPGQTV